MRLMLLLPWGCGFVSQGPGQPTGCLKIFFFFLIYLFNLFILAALGLCCCTRAFSSCGERGLLFVAVHRLLIAVASLVAEHRLQTRRLSSCGSWAHLLRDVGSSQTRARTRVPCIGRQTLNHCATREAQQVDS